MNNLKCLNISLISTYDSDYIRMIVNNLKEYGYYPKHIYLANKVGQVMFKFNSLVRIIKRLGLIEAIKRVKSNRYNTKHLKKENYLSINDFSKKYNIKIDYYDHIKSGRLLAKLLQQQPKVIALAGCGIVDASLISIPEKGCVNAHPAILPGIRGVDVIEWSLIYNYPMGVTAHLVDDKVDSGKIIQTKMINLLLNESFDEFKYRVLKEQAKIMADSIISVYEDKAKYHNHNLTKSKLCFSIDSANRKRAKEIYYKRQKELL